MFVNAVAWIVAARLGIQPSWSVTWFVFRSGWRTRWAYGIPYTYPYLSYYGRYRFW